jgi:hypothetical protein
LIAIAYRAFAVEDAQATLSHNLQTLPEVHGKQNFHFKAATPAGGRSSLPMIRRINRGLGIPAGILDEDVEIGNSMVSLDPEVQHASFLLR